MLSGGLNILVCCGYSKEHKQQMFELMDKKIFIILAHCFIYLEIYEVVRAYSGKGGIGLSIKLIPRSCNSTTHEKFSTKHSLT